MTLGFLFVDPSFMNYLYIALPVLVLATAAGFAITGGKSVRIGYRLLTIIILLMFAFFVGTMIGFVIP